MNKISQHITYEEATHSDTATRLEIDNSPNEIAIENMKYVAENVFEKMRTHFNKPIGISSFFRSNSLNKAISGSSTTSQHTTGQAIDIDAKIFGGLTNAQIFYFIKDNLQFDQLIWEYGTETEPDWVHVSLKRTGNRAQVLRCLKGGKYIKF